MNLEDHDLLTKIDQKLETLVDSVKAHLNDDKESFRKIDGQFAWVYKILYMGLGALAVIQLFVKLQ